MYFKFVKCGLWTILFPLFAMVNNAKKGQNCLPLSTYFMDDCDGCLTERQRTNGSKSVF